MNSHPLTVSTLPEAPVSRTVEDVAVAQLQGRCTSKVYYAPKATSTGQRLYGYFSMDADALGDAVGETLVPNLHGAEAEPVGLLTLHRWLRDHDPVSEPDESASVLPAMWSALEPVIETLVAGHRARVFCECCNRNVGTHDLRRECSVDAVDGGPHQFFCTAGHLLASLRSSPGVGAALVEQRAA
jgi:hypothetical protein